MLGPCWRCGAYGHIQAHCPMPQGRLYPLLQPVVSTSAEVDIINEVSACVGTSNVYLEHDILCVKCVDSVECNVEATKMNAETQLTHHKGVNWATAEFAVMKGHADETKPELVTIQGIFSDPVVHDTIVDTCKNEDFSFKFWEFGSDEPHFEDVQGWLRHNIVFWKEVLHAPSPILDCIENGYHLPLKFIPLSRFQGNHHAVRQAACQIC